MDRGLGALSEEFDSREKGYRRGPKSPKFLWKQRYLVATFLCLAFGRFAFERKTNHHFNKNLDAQRGFIQTDFRNSGIEGTKFIGLIRPFSNFNFYSDYFYESTGVCGRKNRKEKGIFVIARSYSTRHMFSKVSAMNFIFWEKGKKIIFPITIIRLRNFNPNPSRRARARTR